MVWNSDWLIDGVEFWLIDWLIDGVEFWLIDWLMVWNSDWLIDWLKRWLRMHGTNIPPDRYSPTSKFPGVTPWIGCALFPRGPKSNWQRSADLPDWRKTGRCRGWGRWSRDSGHGIIASLRTRNAVRPRRSGHLDRGNRSDSDRSDWDLSRKFHRCARRNGPAVRGAIGILRWAIARRLHPPWCPLLSKTVVFSITLPNFSAKKNAKGFFPSRKMKKNSAIFYFHFERGKIMQQIIQAFTKPKHLLRGSPLKLLTPLPPPLAFWTLNEIKNSAHSKGKREDWTGGNREKVGQLCPSTETGAVQGWAMVDSWCQLSPFNQSINDRIVT